MGNICLGLDFLFCSPFCGLLRFLHFGVTSKQLQQATGKFVRGTNPLVVGSHFASTGLSASNKPDRYTIMRHLPGICLTF